MKIPRAYSFSKIAASAERTRKRRLKTHPIVLTENGCIHLGIHRYEVDLDRIKNPRDLLAWVAHLLEKNWVDARMAREFIILASEQKGINPFGLDD